MKLYYLTSSLNLDNILSTESISPLSYYPQRSFGYGTFYAHPESLRHYTHEIILFSQLPHYDIFDEERYSYPCIIEIEIIDSQMVREIGKFEDCSVFSCNTTIQFTSNNVRILFFSDKDLEYTWQSCSDSALCKMFDHYKFAIAKGRLNLDLIIRNIHYPGCDYYVKSDENDYDKVKGFFAGCILGFLNRRSKDIAELIKIKRSIYNMVASIKNDIDNVPETTFAQIKELDRTYDNYDPAVKELRQQWTELIARYDSTILEVLEIQGYAKRKFADQRGLRIRNIKFSNIHKNGIIYDNGLSEYIKELENQTEYIISKSKNTEKDVNCDSFNFVSVVENGEYICKIEEKNQDDRLFNLIIKRIFFSGIIPFTNVLSINRSDITYKTTLKVKEIEEELGRSWNGGKTQLYFHHLRENIIQYKPFNLKEIDNPVYQALAIFLLKGEDFNDMMIFAEENAFPNLEYLFPLWGITTGYVNITRNIFQNYISSDNFLPTTILAFEKIQEKKHHEVINSSVIKDDPTQISDILAAKIEECIKSSPQISISTKEKAQIKEALRRESERDNIENFLFVLNNYISPRTNVFKKVKEYLEKFFNGKDSIKKNIDDFISQYNSPKKKDTEYFESLKTCAEAWTRVDLDSRASIF